MDEDEAVRLLKAKMREGVSGDDVALLRAGKGMLVTKVDMLVGSTDVPRGMTYRQASRKAVAACVSDFAAKGVRPSAFLASLGLRKGTKESDVELIAAGFADAQREWGADLIGGDTNESLDLVIDCAMFGFADRIVERKGARPGDLLVVSGNFGLPPSGLLIMAGKAVGGRGFSTAAVESVTTPRPDLKAGVVAGKFLTSAMDSSDGLSRSIHELARRSGVGFQVETPPVAKGVAEFAERNRLSADKLVFQGGEEYVIVGTLREETFEAAKREVTRAGGVLKAIGRATERKEVVLRKDGRVAPLKDEGWTHLRG
jgi:thiamine-monophosphate kinase